MDPIVEAALSAVKGLGRTRSEPNAAPVPVVTSEQRSAHADGPRTTSFSSTLKSAGVFSTEDQPAGSALNPIASMGLFARIRKASSWLQYTRFAPVNEKTGYLSRWDDRDFRMSPVPTEGERRGIPSHKPDVTNDAFACKTMSGALTFYLDSLRQVSRSGQNVNAFIRQGVAAGIANTIADLAINGDTSLPSDSSLNIQRSRVDGFFKRIRANSTRYRGYDNGFSYRNGIWAAKIQDIDQPYRAASGLAWGLTDSLATRWLTELTALYGSPANSHPSIINPTGERILHTASQDARPMNKLGVIIPQMGDSNHSTREGYSGIAPTSITNNSNGTLTININTLAVSGTDRSSTGTDGQRYVTVGRTSTGVEETLAVSYSAPNNTVTTTSLLGQGGSVSTTAGDYYVKWADTQSLFYGLMGMLNVVMRNGVRLYSVFYPRDEVIEVIVHMDLDFIITDYDAMTLTDDIITPRFDILPA